MAKALIGHLDVDRRDSARLAVENARLRARVAELETAVLHLCEENDALVAARAPSALDCETRPLARMQPV